MDRKGYSKEYYKKNKEKLLSKQNEYYKNNKNIHKAYYQRNKKRIIEYQLNYQEEYGKTPIARASSLLQAYNNSDKKACRGKGDLTSQWIVDNIFTKPCVHCGKTGWEIIGCNRLDNSKPHTMDNVEPCCFECNIKALKMERNKDGTFKKIKGA